MSQNLEFTVDRQYQVYIYEYIKYIWVCVVVGSLMACTLGLGAYNIICSNSMVTSLLGYIVYYVGVGSNLNPESKCMRGFRCT
jgi:hypothetical protein